MVLRGDVALAGDHAGARDVVTTVTELHLLGLSTDGTGNQLMTKTDTENGNSVLFHGLGQIGDGSGEGGRVTRTVRNEQTIVVLAGEGREIVIPGNDQNLNATCKQATQLVELHTDVQAENADGTTGGVFEGNVLGGREETGFLDRDYPDSLANYSYPELTTSFFFFFFPFGLTFAHKVLRVRVNPVNLLKRRPPAVLVARDLDMAVGDLLV